MNTRFKLVHKRSKRGRDVDGSKKQVVGVTEVKDEPYTPAFSDISQFGDVEDSRSPQQDSVYSHGSDLASPSSFGSMSPTGPIYSAFPHEHKELPFPPPARNDTVFSASTQMSTDSVRNIRTRLGVTTVFAKQVGVLMKRLTIGNSQAFPSPLRAPSDVPAHHHGYLEPLHHPGLSLPGDFIVARKYVQQCSHAKHFLKYTNGGRHCWCAIADDASESSNNFYIASANEDWCDRAQHVLTGQVSASCVDDFGNTPLHFFASLESQQGIETTFHLIESDRSNPLATNNGGQTFLHMLSAAWFFGLDDQDRQGPLYRLLNLLWRRDTATSNAVFARDVYGRTFFHRLARFVTDVQLFTSISQHYTWDVIPRDAFGSTRPGHVGDHLFSPPRRTGTTALSPLAEEIQDEDLATKSKSLINTLAEANENLTFEDDEGRNSLHCLAEVDFVDVPTPSSPCSPSSPNPEKKRKRGQSDTTDGPRPIERRADYLEGHLLQTRNVERHMVSHYMNHYNKAGHTPLMAFATHLTDAADKSGQQTGRIIDLLLCNGARIDMRNRQGETALLMAARAGNKSVVTKLLERGANLHTRNNYGMGIMGVLDAKIAACNRDRAVSEYGRLEAVRAVLAKVLLEMGGEDEPGFLEEWSRPSGTRA